jgi:hypothetical protein
MSQQFRLFWSFIFFVKLIGVLGFVGLGMACAPIGPRSNDLVPVSLKGYELYSWQRGGVLWFTLITGTNREKEIEEIVSVGDVWSSDGWIKITVQGQDEGLALLARLHPGETLILSQLPDQREGLDSVEYHTPPPEVIAVIEKYAREIGLQLTHANRE